MKRVLEDPCIAKAMDDEPAFILLARDPLAPALVRLWATFRRLEVASGARDAKELDQIGAAELEAERMAIWRRDADESWRKQGKLALEDSYRYTCPVHGTFITPLRHFEYCPRSGCGLPLT